MGQLEQLKEQLISRPMPRNTGTVIFVWIVGIGMCFLFPVGLFTGIGTIVLYYYITNQQNAKALKAMMVKDTTASMWSIIKRYTDDDMLSPDEIENVKNDFNNEGYSSYANDEFIHENFDYFIASYQIANNQLPQIDSDFFLKTGEVCLFRLDNVSVYERKEITKSVGATGVRFSVPLAKGIRLSTGKYNIQRNTQVIQSLVGSGVVNITNKGLLFKSDKGTITITKSSIVDIEQQADGITIFKRTGKPLLFSTPQAVHFYQYLLLLMNKF